MSDNYTKTLIDDIVKTSKGLDSALHEKIIELTQIYQAKENQCEHFLKQYDKRNSIANEADLKKDKLLEQQSRLAAVGEMMDSVAHQWKQPLNSISMMNDMLQDDFKNSLVDEHYIKEITENTNIQIEHMVSTLNEFRNFFRPSTKNEDFLIEEAIQSTQILMKDELISQNVHLCVESDNNTEIFGNKNEFKHLFINLINNSIDAFNEKDIDKRNITIKCYKKDHIVYIELEDNAGGIPLDVIDDIFKPNFTTKAEGKGTGIGLYMSSKIVHKNNGKIEVSNSKLGALFTITLR